MIWRCFICYVFVALSLRQLLSHINTMHSRSPDFRVVCGIDGCPSEYRVYNSFYYHVKRTHARHLLGVEADEEEGSTRHGLPGAGERTDPINQTNASSSVTDEGSSIPALTSGFQEDGEGHLNLDFYKHATAFLLQAKETHRLTQRAVNHIVSGIQQYQAVLLEHLKQEMSDTIERHFGDLDQLKSDTMGVFDQFVDPFTQIASTHLQDKTIKELLKPVEPEIIVTKLTVCYSKRGDSRVLAIKDHCFHYIPLVKSLEQLLSHPRMLAMIDERPKPCKDGQVVTASGERTIHGALISVCGDTLAQHEVAGFKEGVGFAYSKCRHCDCHFEDMQEKFNEDLFVKRTMASHNRQCNDIEKASTDFLKDNLKITYGINRRSKLTESPHVDIINQTPQDIMHVILEGVAPYEIKCVLKNLVLSGQMNLDSFNSAILCFSYSPVDVRDKPCPISVSTLSSNDNKLKQSAGQMLVLLKILPFLMDKIGENHYTQMLRNMLEIIKILFSPIIAVSTLSRLKLLIELHLKHFKQLFPDENIIPKQHYLLHLPSQIKALDPTVRHMCMRFESKHCFFKQWALKSSFKNICKSLVKHNQLYECSQNVHEKHPIFFQVKNVHYVEGKIKDFIEQVDHVVSVQWIMLHGNKHSCEKSLVISDVINDAPEFALVKNIYIVNASVYCFECQPLSTVGWNDQYLAYEVEVPCLAQANIFVDAGNLVDYTAYHYVNFNNSKYIPVKYDLTDIIKHHS
ncbi:hypothetical protein ACER0C_003177 [Sarotherodon galilaeus]